MRFLSIACGLVLICASASSAQAQWFGQKDTEKKEPVQAAPTQTTPMQTKPVQKKTPPPAEPGTCAALPDYNALKDALKTARKESNGGLNFDMWGTIVDRSGKVCAVAFTGRSVGAQWPGSRLISAQKANTANAFSLDGLALSTANLFSPVQPGGSLYGLQHSNPLNVPVAYNKKGNVINFGTPSDPLVSEFIGGTNVFGGGLALYSKDGKVVGGLGVSGDTSCADHNIAWRTRHSLNQDYVSAGVSKDKNDQIIFDITNGSSAGGYGHPACGEGGENIVALLPATRAVVEAKADVKPEIKTESASETAPQTALESEADTTPEKTPTAKAPAAKAPASPSPVKRQKAPVRIPAEKPVQ